MTDTNSPVQDDIFAQHSKLIKKQAEENAQKTASGSGNYTPRDYETIQWSGLEVGKYKAYRLLGAPLGSEASGYKRKPTDPKYLFYSEIKDDAGKKMQLKLPQKGEMANKDHIMHRLIAKVLETEWVKIPGTEKNKKTFKWETRYPELFEWVSKGGLTSKDPYYSYTRGAKGQMMALFNVIDRTDDWCKTNKHTKLLSKSVTIGENGQIMFPAIGVGAFGFTLSYKGLSSLDALLTSKACAKYSGNYEKFDIAIMRSGTMENPYRLLNASFLKEGGEATQTLLENQDGTEFNWDLVETGPLTSDELSYERYDLDKLMAPTTYQKLLKRIPNVFKMFDAAFNLGFYEELQKLAEKEKVEFKDKYGDGDQELEQATAQATQNESDAIGSNLQKEENIPEEIPEATVRRSVAKPNSDKLSCLKGYDKLTDKEKSQIKDVILDGDKVKEIIFTDDAAATIECDNVLADGSECGIPVPSDWQHCPCCGAEYSFE